MLLAFKLPASSDRSPRYMEAALNAVHESNPHRLAFRLELAMRGSQIGLYCRVPPVLKSLVLDELRDAYPGSHVSILPDDALHPPADTQTMSALLHLTPDVLPIKTYRAFEDTLHRVLADPLAGLLSALRTSRNGKLLTRVLLFVRPASNRRVRKSCNLVPRLQRSFTPAILGSWHRRFSTHPRLCGRVLATLLARLSRQGDRDIAGTTGKLEQHLFEVHLQIRVSAPPELRRRASEKLTEIAGAFGRFTSGQTRFTAWRLSRGTSAPRGRGFLLNAEELATLWHPPVSSVRVSRIERSSFREMEPPINLSSREAAGDATTLGRVCFRQRRNVFGIRTDDLRRHLFICGRTGTGKSTLIKTMVIDGLHAGRNVCLIDPHGDLTESVLDAVPPRRTNDVVLFSAGDRSFPVAFNPLFCPHPELRPLLADGLVGAMKRLYGDSWGPRLEQILRNGVLLLLERREATLIDLQRLLTDGAYRATQVDRSSDPVVRAFWRDTFGKWNDRFRTEAVSPVLNKIDGFLSNPIARAITCQGRSTINLRTILDNPRAIFLCNLCKGLVGEETSGLLGAFLVASLQAAALSRAEIAEEQRTDVQVYIDEFHSFVSESNTSFATILSESRKYRVAFAALATQFLDQMDENTLASVLGNCGGTVAFRCGARDAETIAELLGGDLTADDVLSLPNYTAYARLLVDGEPTAGPFSMTTIPSPRPYRRRAEVVRRVSRQRYGRPIAQVERGIHAALGID